MKIQKKFFAIAFVVVVIILGTVAYITSYNNGSVGNKAEKKAAEFVEELSGTWSGPHSISSLTFDKDGNVTLTVLGVNVKGEYEDTYNLKTETNTVSVHYTTALGISIDKKYTASINEKSTELTLHDITLSKDFVYSRGAGNFDKQSESEEKSSTTSNEFKTLPTLPEKSTKQDDKSEKSTNKITEKTTENKTEIAVNDESKNFLLGKWVSDKNPNAGYTFSESSVKVSLLGMNYDGKYKLYKNSSGAYELYIVYASIGSVEIRNTYYVSVSGNTMTLALKTDSSNISTYTKAG